MFYNHYFSKFMDLITEVRGECRGILFFSKHMEMVSNFYFINLRIAEKIANSRDFCPPGPLLRVGPLWGLRPRSLGPCRAPHLGSRAPLRHQDLGPWPQAMRSGLLWGASPLVGPLPRGSGHRSPRDHDKNPARKWGSRGPRWGLF